MRLVGRHDLDAAVLFNVDAGAGLLGDRTDVLAAGADQRADLLRIDLDPLQPRRAAADLRTRRRDACLDHVEDLQPGNPVAFHSFAQKVDRNAGQLEVELESGDSVAGAADLEVHVAEVVLGADDVGEQQPFAVQVERPFLFEAEMAEAEVLGGAQGISVVDKFCHAGVESGRVGAPQLRAFQGDLVRGYFRKLG